MNDSKLMSFNADDNRCPSDRSPDEITRERLLARDDSEHMGHAARSHVGPVGGVGGIGQDETP